MPVTEIGDPRLQALFGASDPRDAGVRPAVRLPRRGLPPVALAAIAIVFGLLLFLVLNERRTSQSEPSVKVRPDSDASAWAAPPPLYVPPETAPATSPIQPQEQQPQAAPVVAAPAPAPVARPGIVQPVYLPQPVPQMAPVAPAPQPRASGGAPLVIDTGGAPGAAAGSSPGTLSSIVPQGGPAVRMRASALANRSMTITQGTLIQAVLETGFDSTQPGFARAVVARDVRSFDASNVLIPRGSKLIGEYRSDVAQGQKRAVIIWTRLIRPDGMTITMDSPAVDTLGRGGVAASVNTHFFARLGDALLQSTIGIGSALAQRRVAGPVVVLSGSTTAATGPALPANNYVPTLTVPAGKSISVFVAHDLDFSAAGAPR
jgi:type IV secretion system protein VirB10